MLDDTETTCRGSINMRGAKLKLDPSDKLKFEIISSGKNAVRYHLRANHPVEANRWIFALTQAIQAATAEAISLSSEDSLHHRTASSASENVSGHRSTPSLDLKQKLLANSSAASINTEDESGEESQGNNEEPHRGDFEATAHSAIIQLEILEKLVGALPQNDQQPFSDDSIPILKKAVSSLHGTLDELVRMSETRDKYWKTQLEKERELRLLWEENMQILADEQEQMEEAMNNAIKQRRMTKRALKAISIAVQQPEMNAEIIRRLSVSEGDSLVAISKPDVLVSPEELVEAITSDEEEDIFFDAVGSDAATFGEPAPVPEPAPVKSLIESKEISPKDQELAIAAHGYQGPLRTKFEKLDKDNRPKISLWGILKSMVGKDMTRMVKS